MPRLPRPSGPPDTVWFGGHAESATLCLRVCGDDLDPDEITRLLGRAPTRSQRKGQPVLDEFGSTKRVARTGSWLLDYALSPEATISEAIESLLETLPGDTQLWQTLGERFSVDLLCDIFVRGVNQGFVLAPRVLEALGRRRIELGLDIFCRSDLNKPRR